MLLLVSRNNPYMGYSATVRSRSGGHVSNVLRNFLYQITYRKTHTQFFFRFFFYFSFSRYHFLSKKLYKIWKNSHKSYKKIYLNFLAILEDGEFKTAPVKKKIKMKKKKLECILYVEINKKVRYKIVRKIDIKMVTWLLIY